MSKERMLSKLLLMVLLITHVIGIASHDGSDKRILKTIQTKDGDIIDCFDVYKQPALDDPLLKNHEIQMRPTKYLSSKNCSESESSIRISGCPQGTVPILRIPNKDVLQSNFSEKDVNGFDDWAVAYNKIPPYIGVSGRLMLWVPHTQPGEHSLSFVAIGQSGGTPEDMQNSIVAGWGVLPSLYGDFQTRFFIALIKANGAWCFVGKDCASGFVQVNKLNHPGDRYDKTSVYGDPKRQVFTTIDIFKDLNTNNWWIAAGGENIGYFSNSVIGRPTADIVTWGGKVHKVVATPTHTQMGSGHFTKEGYAKTGIVFGARARRPGVDKVVEKPSGYFVTRPSSFDFHDNGRIVPNMDKEGYYFMYGGPGL